MVEYSIVIPHKDSLALLKRCVDSIPLREDVEVIIVDDNSVAEEKPYINRKGVRIIYLSNQDSKGAGHARNEGLKYVSGKWVLFADADDYYADGFLDVIQSHITDDTEILYFGVKVNCECQNLRSFMSQRCDGMIEAFKQGTQRIRDMRRVAMSIYAPWNKVYSKHYISRLHAYFEEIPIGNDGWFVTYLGSKTKKLKVISEKLYYYSPNKKGLSNREKDSCLIFMLLKSRLKQNNLKIKNDLWDIVDEYDEYESKLNTSDVLKWKIYRIYNDYSIYYRLRNKLFKTLGSCQK